MATVIGKRLQFHNETVIKGSEFSNAEYFLCDGSGNKAAAKENRLTILAIVLDTLTGVSFCRNGGILRSQKVN